MSIEALTRLAHKLEMHSSTSPPSWPVPANEEERLKDLASLDMLDTPEEEPFDGLVEIAAALFETPVAAIALMDSNRQWFKATVGIPMASTSRAEAFCAYTIMSTKTMVVEDLSEDPRFANHPFVVGGPCVRSYAGAPLVTDGRRCVGTICVLDTKPRQFTEEKLRLLERLAKSAMGALQSQRLIRQLSGSSSGR